jgi:hypothetical protein
MFISSNLNTPISSLLFDAQATENSDSMAQQVFQFAITRFFDAR